MSWLSTHKFFSSDSYTIKKTYKLDLYQENKLKMRIDLTLEVIQTATKKLQSFPSGLICQPTGTAQAVRRDNYV
jgi:hypothetical protein